MKLNWSEVLELKDTYDYLEPGQMVRVNHNNDGCNGTSPSLKIERKDDGTLSIYCFRCGGYGYYGNPATLKSLKARADTSKGSSNTGAGTNKELPGDGKEFGEGWNPHASAWIGQADLTEQEIKDNGLLWSDSIGRVILPWYDGDGNLSHYQTRRVLPDDNKPKYLTYFINNDPVVLGAWHTGCRSIILVEDRISAIKVARHSPVMALLGVNLGQEHVDYLIQHGHNNFLVWLDDDNIQVQRAQLKIKRNLDKIGKCLIYHAKGVDPKESTDEEIRNIIARWHHGFI